MAIEEALERTNGLLSFHSILSISYDRDRIENTVYLLSRCLATAVYSGSNVPSLRRRAKSLPPYGCSSLSFVKGGHTDNVIS
jgi:hypothetical protein